MKITLKLPDSLPLSWVAETMAEVGEKIVALEPSGDPKIRFDLDFGLDHGTGWWKVERT